MKRMLILVCITLASCVTIYRYDIKCEPPVILDKPFEPFIPKRHYIEPFDYGILKYPNSIDTGMMWDTIAIDTMGLMWTK